MAQLVLLVWCSFALGCAGAQRRPLANAPLGRHDMADRLALGSPDAGWQGANDLEYSAALAKFARRIGHVGAATQAATEHLSLALAANQLDYLDAVKTRASRRALLRATDLAVDIGRWAEAHELVVAAALASPKPRRHQRALLSSVHELLYLPAAGIDTDILLARLQGHPAAEAAVHARLWREDVPEALLDASPRHEPALRGRALSISIKADDRPGILRHARRLATLDPSDTRHGILALATVEVRAGVLMPGPSLWSDIMLSYVSTPVSARHRRRLTTFPRSDSVVLAQAAGLLSQGLIGDALQVMEGREFRSGEAADIAVLLRALAEAHAGDTRAYDDWRRAHPESYPLTAEQALANLAPDEGAPVLRAIAAEARRRLVEFAPQPTVATLASAVLDEALAATTRARAGDALQKQNPMLWSLLSACMEHEQAAAPKRCGDLNDDYMLDDEWGLSPELLARYGRSQWITPQWFAVLDWWDEEADLSTVTALLPYLDTTTVSTSPTYQEAAFTAELHEGQTTAARERLDRTAAMWNTRTLLRAQLQLRDVESGRSPAESVRTAHLALTPLVRTVESGRSWGDADDTTLLGRVALASQKVREGNHAAAADLLAKLSDGSDGRAAGILAARAAAAAFAVGATERGGALLARLQALAPASAELAFVRGVQAEHAGSSKQAVEFYRTARRRDPSLRIAFEGEVAMLGALKAGVDVQSVWSSRPDFVHIAGVMDAVRGGSLQTVAQLAEVQRAGTDNDLALALGPPRGEAHSLTHAAMRSSRASVAAATSLAAARTHAKTAIGYLDGLSPKARAQHRDDEVWMRFLLGQTKRALALCNRNAPAWDLSPLAHGSMPMILLRAQADGSLKDADTLAAWRYAALEEEEAFVELTIADPGGAMTELACAHYTGRNDFRNGKPACLAVASLAGASAMARGNYSYALLRTEPVTSPALTAFMTSDGAQQTYDPASVAQARDHEGLAVLTHNRALWLEDHGRCEEAAGVWVNALAMGTQRGSEHPFAEPCAVRLGEVHRSWALWRQGFTPEQRALQLATSAMRSADLVAAGHYGAVARARFIGTAGARATVATADRYHHLATLIAADLRDHALGPDTLVEVTTLIEDEASPDRRAALHKAHPKSRTAQLLLAEAERARRNDAEVAKLVETLLPRAASNPVVVALAAASLADAGKLVRAQKLYADAHKKHPTSVTLADAKLPESVRGSHAGVPVWVRSAEDFDSRLAAVRDQDLAALSPKWRSHTDTAADAFFPAHLAPRTGHPVAGYDEHNNRAFVTHDARASRCEGKACAEATLRTLMRDGGTVLWEREIQRPDGPAYEATIATATEVWNVVSIPAGGRVYHLVVVARHEVFGEWMPALRLLRESFAPLDRTLQASRAAGLRVGGAKLSERARLRGRLAYYDRDDDGGCPVRPHLEMFGRADLRGEAVLDLMLLAPDSAARRALLGCVAAQSPEAARLALPALLDEDAWLHEYGREGTTAHASQVLRDVKEVLVSPLEPPQAAADYFTRPDLPAYGLLEVALALPTAEGREFVAAALDSTSDSERAMAWSAMRMDPDLVLNDRVSQAIETVDLDDDEPSAGLDAALRALSVLLTHGGQSHEPLLRTRLDQIKRIDTPAALRLVRSLAFIIATLVSDDDSARLRAAASRVVATAPGLSEESAHMLQRLASSHKRAVAQRANPEAAHDEDDIVAGLLLDMHARNAAAPPAPHNH